jgi:hypothetical protein
MTDPTAPRVGGGRPKGSKNTSEIHSTPSFEEPPPASSPRTRATSVWTGAAASLRSNPDQWAHVSTHKSESSAKQAASGIRNGRRKGFDPAGAFESRHAAIPGGDGRYGVWARFLSSSISDSPASTEDSDLIAV